MCIQRYNEDTKTSVQFNLQIQDVLKNFIAFLNGDKMESIHDYHKVRQALESRNEFLGWMKRHGIKDARKINPYVKGIRSVMQEEIGIGPKPFKKAVKFYESISDKGSSNFKVSI